MPQRKPVLHARDHLPGGADPLPGVVGAAGPSVPPVSSGIPSAGQPSGEHVHWWRFREPVYADTPPEASTVADSGEGFTSGNPMSLITFLSFDLPSECTARQPGPNADSVSMHRVRVSAASNPFNLFKGMAAIGHIDLGPGTSWTIVGWFKFDALKSWDVFNVTQAGGDVHPTYLLLNPNGSVTLGRDSSTFTSAGGLISAGTWCYLAISLDHGRLKVYVNPGAPVATDFNPWFGGDFPFPGPLGMDTWGLAVGQYSGAELAQQLLANGFKTAVVQLNAQPAAGDSHADYIAQLSADVAAMKAAGLFVVGWGEVDGTTGADLSATGVQGWMPQIEGDSQRLAVISALGAGVGAGLPKAVVATAGGLDTAGKVADLHAAGITHAAVETYAEQGAYPYSNVDVMLSNFVNLGWDKDNLIPMLGTYRDETPASYVGLDEDVLPNFGIYNTAQTSDAAWDAFKELSGGGQLMLTNAVIDVADPATGGDATNFTIGSPWSDPGTPNHNWSAEGAFEGYVTEVAIYEHALAASEVRETYESGAYGDTGTVPPQAQIPPAGITAVQIAPGAEGQLLGTQDGVAQWLDFASADLVYNGVYTPDTEYTDGDIVIHDGVLYLCVQPTSDPPSGWEEFV